MNLKPSILQWAAILIAMAALIIVVVFLKLVTQGPPAIFYDAKVHPTPVQPGQYVEMEFHVESPLDPKCLVATQYFIRASDGTLFKLPGWKRTTRDEIKDGYYRTVVPPEAPRGQARFFIRETYNCGYQARRAETPEILFTIGAPQ